VRHARLPLEIVKGRLRASRRSRVGPVL
jgi:hypothetical protein